MIDVYNQVSDDGGKTFRQLGETNKHVDNHVIWIDPHDTDHLIVGCDGGLYESCDRAATLGVQGEPAGHAVLPRRRRRLVAGLLRLRRHAGQQHPRRPVAHADAQRRDELRLVRHVGRRRLPQPRRAGQPQHRLRDAAVRRARPLRPQERRGDPHPAAGGEGRPAAALELGLARCSSARTPPRGCTSRPTACSAATIAAARGSRSAPTSPASSIATR